MSAVLPAAGRLSWVSQQLTNCYFRQARHAADHRTRELNNSPPHRLVGNIVLRSDPL